jgi:hypothetical protein
MIRQSLLSRQLKYVAFEKVPWALCNSADDDMMSRINVMKVLPIGRRFCRFSVARLFRYLAG